MARKTKEDAQAMRNHILDAAERLFDSQGVSRTTLQAIANDVGATRGAVYWHFKDKADLFNAMMARIEWPMDKEALCRQDPESELHKIPPLVSLRNVVLDCLGTIANNDQVRRLLNICHYQIELTEDMYAVRQRMLQAHDDFYERHLQAFSHPHITPHLQHGMTAHFMASTLQNAVLGLIATWLLDPQAFDLVSTGDSMMDLILRGAGLDPQWARLDATT
ncbi:TetR family transcriptional regulator [Lampropedia puyangensis]|uniref:TetR family transcriptional regulator n=1 Tax=Lampropedia puyangensis TaxID=1330072 RepID=A0A4S8F6K4_9BURK|nr:TetR family transcriptional regulator [Lampropedia puyangensis]THU02521.1 TetR family transcriptional regulator [Lampropedia puyangensis]